MLHVILGCMGSGKSTELLRRVRRHTLAGHSVTLITFAESSPRYGQPNNTVCTHDKVTSSALALPSDGLTALDPHSLKCDVVAIDEAQFFSQLVQFVVTALQCGITVIVAGLDGTACQTPFGETLQLIPHCDTVQKLTAVCVRCRCADAIYTVRRDDVCTDDSVCIGGFDVYAPVCRGCVNDGGVEHL